MARHFVELPFLDCLHVLHLPMPCCRGSSWSNCFRILCLWKCSELLCWCSTFKRWQIKGKIEYYNLWASIPSLHTGILINYIILPSRITAPCNIFFNFEVVEQISRSGMLSRSWMLLMWMYQKPPLMCKRASFPGCSGFCLKTNFGSWFTHSFFTLFTVDRVEIYSLRTVSKSLAGKPDGWNSKSLTSTCSIAWVELLSYIYNNQSVVNLANHDFCYVIDHDTVNMKLQHDITMCSLFQFTMTIECLISCNTFDLFSWVVRHGKELRIINCLNIIDQNFMVQKVEQTIDSLSVEESHRWFLHT